ncbi:MAG: NADP-specific glutamate dehydrogenase [Clostridiales bacterium]|jgi:glutamate dehydrogenase (NADP+)|nr:NADP-specific glutamate dehydrogenase [Clostridiales bacterium]
MNTYIASVLDDLQDRYPHQPEFLQAAQEMLPSLEVVFERHPEYRDSALLERFVEPERAVLFRVPWVDDGGQVRVNRGYRVQFSSAIGPYKGGLRFHPSVTLGMLKFLALEQTLKNSLTGLPIGGAKGGADFNPRAKSDGEVMRFCQSFMTELVRHIGPRLDIPAGDIGVGAREIGFLFGQYKRLVARHEGAMTGKGMGYGGSQARTEATGYGLMYLVKTMLDNHSLSPEGMRAVISGSGNVAIYAAQKAAQMGVHVIAMSDSEGFILDGEGIDLSCIKNLKLTERARISEYPLRVGRGNFHPGANGIWQITCDLALPCATQNELDEAAATALIRNGVKAVAEGANMPATLAASRAFQDAGVLFMPGKAANAGGVAVSALEMAQNAGFTSWTFDKVDRELQAVMDRIYHRVAHTAARYGKAGDFILGANVAGFLQVADAMMAQGVV